MTTLLLSLVLSATVHAASAPGASSLKVLALSGRATLDGQPLQPGGTLPEGLSVQVSGGAKLTLDDGRGGRLLVNGPATFKAGKRTLDLSAGGVLAVLKSAFSVRTKTAVAAVRGTTFYVEARGKTATYVCICDGAIDVTRRGGKFKSKLETKQAHKSFLFDFAKSGAGTQSESPMERHTDEEIARLKTL